MKHTSDPAEEWRPVVGWENRYEVSDHGRVRSLTRWMINKAGRRQKTQGRLLKLQHKPAGYPYINLCKDGSAKATYVHELVLTAFVGPRPSPKHVARHLDDVPNNNHLSNLAWGSESENMLDQSANGGNHWANRDQCAHGHDYTTENTRIRAVGVARVRICRTCVRNEARQRNASRREYKRRWRAKRRAEGKPVT